LACFGLQLVRFTTEARLAEIIAIHEAAGCPIFNPHAYTLEEGGMKKVDHDQLAFKREADPLGLLNPGKMLAWEDPDWTPRQSRHLYETA
jgi:FAD/FMN-containing dehydrogenase